MYSFSSQVRYSECDDHARLSLVSLINYLQDCSTFHTESLGLGIEHMARNHFAWIIAAWQIEIDDLPRFTDHITVSTWCYDMKRTYALRNFCISDEAGTPLVRADSMWLTFDTAAKQPMRIPASEYAYLSDEPRMDMPPTKRKLHVEGPWYEALPVQVSEQHLDTNHHVNNAQYVLMALGALDLDVTPRRICVQYQRQAQLGDIVVPRIHAHETSWTVELTDEAAQPYATVLLET